MTAPDAPRDSREDAARRRASDALPRRVGRYEVLAKIASGGMGSVYWARATGPSGFTKDVAIKLTHPHLREHEGATETLLDEAKLAARVKHVNVVEVIDLGEDGDSLFLVMEYVRGASLSAIFSAIRQEQRPLPLPIAGRILVDALRGLAAVHEIVDEEGVSLGVIHRDVSPHNLLVGLDGVTKLTDFGVAKMRNRLIETASGLVKGKAAYMSPEQARAHPLDQRSDVWSAGVVAWEALANRRLFDSSNEVELLLRLVSETPPLLSEVGVVVPPLLEEAIRDALVPDREKRVATAAELARRISLAIPDLADHPAVGAFIRPLVEPKLAERQRDAKRRATSPDALPAADADADEVATEPDPERARVESATRTTNLVTMSDAVVLPRRTLRPTLPLLGAVVVGAIGVGIYLSSSAARAPSAGVASGGATDTLTSAPVAATAAATTPMFAASSDSSQALSLPPGDPSPPLAASSAAKSAPRARASASSRAAHATATPTATDDTFDSPYR